MRIFLYGGSFDPVHNGHEKIINNILPLCDKLIIIPTNKSPHKSINTIANTQHRYSMLSLLFQLNKKIDIITYELDKKEPAFTYETISFIKSKYANYNNITFVLGYDLINTLSDWYKINEIKKNVNFIAFHRKNYNIKELDGFNIKFIEDFYVETSSSEIRDLLINKQLEIVRNMIPPLIYDYIIKNNLYIC